MFFKFFRVLCAFSLRLGVFALRNAAVTEVEPYRRTIHGDFLQRRIHRLFGKSIQAKDIADHTFQNLIPDVCIPACPSAVQLLMRVPSFRVMLWQRKLSPHCPHLISPVNS